MQASGEGTCDALRVSLDAQSRGRSRGDANRFIAPTLFLLDGNN